MFDRPIYRESHEIDITIGSLRAIDIPSSLQQKWIGELMAPHRHYHDLTHIRNMLNEYVENGASFAHLGIIIAAIWLHDIVYDPKASDNEEQSARQARHDLRGTDMFEHIDAIEEIILDTKHHRGGSELLDLFCDLDLSIFGKDQKTYERYMQDIRKEYSFVPVDAYCEKRLEILRRFNEGIIFKTKWFERLEAQAHRNLDYEIERLSVRSIDNVQ